MRIPKLPRRLPPERVDESSLLAVERCFRDAEALLGVCLTLHDLSGVFRNPDGESLIDFHRRAHQARVCLLQHSQACIEHCSHAVNRRLRDVGQAEVHECWKGVREIAVPLIRDGSHLATLFAGPFAAAAGIPEPTIVEAAVIAEQARLPSLAAARGRRLMRVLRTFGEGLLFRLEQLHRIDPMTVGDDRAGRIRRYLHYHAHEQISLADLAAALHLSPSRCSHVVSECFGISFRSLLQRERLERARLLLLTQEASVAECARRAGFDDQAHFTRAFKAAFNDAPGRYRRRFKV